MNLFEEFFLLEGCGVGLYSLSFYNLSVGSPYARPKKKTLQQSNSDMESSSFIDGSAWDTHVFK